MEKKGCKFPVFIFGQVNLMQVDFGAAGTSCALIVDLRSFGIGLAPPGGPLGRRPRAPPAAYFPNNVIMQSGRAGIRSSAMLGILTWRVKGPPKLRQSSAHQPVAFRRRFSGSFLGKLRFLTVVSLLILKLHVRVNRSYFLRNIFHWKVV